MIEVNYWLSVNKASSYSIDYLRHRWMIIDVIIELDKVGKALENAELKISI